MTSSHAIVGEKAREQREDTVALGLHGSGLHKEADVLATRSVSSGEAETAARMSSRKVHYGPSGGDCCKKKKSAGGVKITLWLNEKRHNLYLIAVRVYYLSWKEIPDTHGRCRRKQSDRSIWAAQQKQKKSLPGSGSCCPHRSPLSLLLVDSSWGGSTYPLAISPFLNFQPLIHLSGLVVISFILVLYFFSLSSIMDSLETSASFQWVWWPRSQRDCIDS